MFDFNYFNNNNVAVKFNLFIKSQASLTDRRPEMLRLH